MNDLISRQKAIDALGEKPIGDTDWDLGCQNQWEWDTEILRTLSSAEPEIIRCKDCKHWKQQMDYQSKPLSFGFCESEDMWRSLYGETTEVDHIDTDDNHYCGFAERRTDE